jgi:hypothetical protein
MSNLKMLLVTMLSLDIMKDARLGIISSWHTRNVIADVDTCMSRNTSTCGNDCWKKGRKKMSEPITNKPRTEAGKRHLRWLKAMSLGSVIPPYGTAVPAIVEIEEQAAAQERARLRERLGGDGWVLLPTGTTATVVHVVMDDCECGGLGCSLDPEPCCADGGATCDHGDD